MNPEKDFKVRFSSIKYSFIQGWAAMNGSSPKKDVPVLELPVLALVSGQCGRSNICNKVQG